MVISKVSMGLNTPALASHLRESRGKCSNGVLLMSDAVFVGIKPGKDKIESAERSFGCANREFCLHTKKKFEE